MSCFYPEAEGIRSSRYESADNEQFALYVRPWAKSLDITVRHNKITIYIQFAANVIIFGRGIED